MVKTTQFTNFPHDLIIEILSKLPPKSLCRFRCVSKQWFQLLTNDEQFIDRYLKRSKQNPLLLVKKYIMDENRNRVTMELISVNMEGQIRDKFRILIDGLVQTFISCGPISIICSMYSLYVCNPSFHEIVHVPYRSKSRTHILNVGIGYVSSSRDYKIVHLFEDKYSRDRKLDCEIISFRNMEKIKSSSWRRKSRVCSWSAFTEKLPICVNGNIYWARCCGGENRSILSCDLEKEEFSIIDYPTCDFRIYNLMEFSGIKGSLFVIGCSVEMSQMDVWRLDGDKKSWVMEYCIGLFPFYVNFVISWDNQSEEILLHTEQKGLMRYNLVKQSSRRIKYYEGVRSYNKPCVYYHSLSPLHKLN